MRRAWDKNHHLVGSDEKWTPESLSLINKTDSKSINDGTQRLYRTVPSEKRDKEATRNLKMKAQASHEHKLNRNGRGRGCKHMDQMKRSQDDSSNLCLFFFQCELYCWRIEAN